jgi:2-deoxy-D-gluconate 3-dehydrogenase
MQPYASLLNLTEKTALVTGGAMGIGYGIAYRLAEAGARVVIADVNADRGAKAVVDLEAAGFTAAFMLTDVADQEQVQAAVDFTVDTYGGLHILVNNAGIFPMQPVMQMDVTTMQKVFAVNLEGVFHFTKAAAEVMIRQGGGGDIINITSIDALHPSAVGLAVYDASKHGVWGFTKNTALELAPHNIRVNAVAPGGIITPGTGSELPPSPDMQQIQEHFLKKIPMRRMGESDEIGKVVLFLASDMASYMTGSQVVVDGGVLLS